MKRSIARGRVFPQSYSTDRRIGRLSLKAVALFPLMWANADDQGRLCGEPEEIKYACCPNIDHITKADIPNILKELETNKLIKIYPTPRSLAIQLLDWWETHKPQWAWPSEYPPPDEWQDRLRYKRGAKEVVTFNWSASAETSGEQLALPHLRTTTSSPETSAEASGEINTISPLTTLSSEKEEENEKETERGRGRGSSPESSGEEASPSLIKLSILEQNIFNSLLDCFKNSWAKVPAGKPWQAIPREPKPKEFAQLRDFAHELAAAGGCTPSYIASAFNEAASQGKMTISYVRAIILDWMGIARSRSP